jgi:hypothetical protein
MLGAAIMSANTGQRAAGIVLTVIGIIAVFLLAKGGIMLPTDPAHLWAAGAAALGLVTGFTTGNSEKEGSGQEFVKFIGTGILVPLVGGVATLLVNKQVVTEKSDYSGTLLTLKTTTTETPASDGFLHPIAVLGSFFAVFAVTAVVGLFAGMLLRLGGVSVKAI